MSLIEAMAYSFGVVLGDGSLTHRRVTLVCGDVEILDGFLAQTNALFDTSYEYKIRYPRGKPLYYVQIYRRDIYEFFDDHTLGKLRVPLPILDGDRDSKLECIIGLMDTDGTARTDRRSVSFTNTKYTIIKDLVAMGRDIGMNFREPSPGISSNKTIYFRTYLDSKIYVDKGGTFMARRKYEMMLKGLNSRRI